MHVLRIFSARCIEGFLLQKKQGLGARSGAACFLLPLCALTAWPTRRPMGSCAESQHTVRSMQSSVLVSKKLAKQAILRQCVLVCGDRPLFLAARRSAISLHHTSDAGAVCGCRRDLSRSGIMHPIPLCSTGFPFCAPDHRQAIGLATMDRAAARTCRRSYAEYAHQRLC